MQLFFFFHESEFGYTVSAEYRNMWSVIFTQINKLRYLHLHLVCMSLFVTILHSDIFVNMKMCLCRCSWGVADFSSLRWTSYQSSNVCLFFSLAGCSCLSAVETVWCRSTPKYTASRSKETRDGIQIPTGDDGKHTHTRSWGAALGCIVYKSQHRCGFIQGEYNTHVLVPRQTLWA